MMKVPKVLLKAMAKKMSWADAAEIIGISCRSMRRWRERLEKQGYDGLADRRKGKPSLRRVPLATCQRVLGVYREKYFDLSVRHFYEKLVEEHSIQLSYNWVCASLLARSLWAGEEAAAERATPAQEATPAVARHAATHTTAADTGG